MTRDKKDVFMSVNKLIKIMNDSEVDFVVHDDHIIEIDIDVLVINTRLVATDESAIENNVVIVLNII